MICKNVECENEIPEDRTYCSLKCRNIYVNKYLRNYDKVSETYKKKKEDKIEEYLKSPKLCLYCNSIISYELRDNIYCNHSCSAKSVNGKRDYTWGNKIRESLINHYDLNAKVKSKKIEGDRFYELECNLCNIIFFKKRNDIKYCSIECINKARFDRSCLENREYKQYKILSNFKFNLSDYSEEFDFSLVEKYGWYSPSNKKNNLGGVSRDHMISVNEGFKKGIDPNLISHPANCKLMKHTDNISKNKKCTISLEELLIRIEYFEKKYKNKN